MQSDGAWTIVTPFLRRALTTASAFLARASQRFDALWHQCLSHMSQMMSAVSFAGSDFATVTSSYSPEPLNVSTRLRNDRVSAAGLAGGSATAGRRVSESRAARERRASMAGPPGGVAMVG